MKLLKLTLEIQDGYYATIVAAVASKFGYQPKLPNPDGSETPITNPQSAEDFAEQCIAERMLRPAIAGVVFGHSKAVTIPQLKKQIDDSTDAVVIKRTK